MGVTGIPHPAADDIEESVARSHPALIAGRGVVWWETENGEPRVVLVQEIPKDHEPDCADISAAVQRVLEGRADVPHRILLVRAASLPVGSDGRLDRGACRECARAGTLAVIANISRPQDDASTGAARTPRGHQSTEVALTAIWAELLGQSVSTKDHFIDFTDSLSATEYVNRVREVFQVDVSPTALFETIPNVSKLAELIDQATARADTPTLPPTGAVTDAATRARSTAQRANDLAVALSGGSWHVWRTAALRGAGFPARMIDGLAAERTAEAARQFTEARNEVARCRSVLWRELGALVKSATDRETRAELRRTRRRIGRGAARADASLTGERELAAASARRDEAYAALAAVYDVDAERVNGRLMEILSHGRFREAAIWQNRTALSLASSRLEGRRGSAGDRRNAACFIAMLAQRYATKNDSLGFFGPVGWASLTDAATVVEVTPGPTLLARREVYFEGWAIDTLAESLDRNPALRRWTAPRLRSGVYVGPDGVHAPVTGIVTLSPEQRRLLASCDGVTTAQEIATAAVAARPPIADSEAAVFDMLRNLVDVKLLCWRLEVPSQLYPERDLSHRLAKIGDIALRKDCEASLRAVIEARNRVAEAAGHDRALEVALADLDATFARITGRAPSRRAGEMYAARGLVFEDCRRDCDVTLGREFLDRLGAPLSIVLDAARWVSTELRRKFTQHLRTCLAQLRAMSRTDTVDAHLFMKYVGAKGRDLTASISQDVLARFQERWRWVLNSQTSEARHTFTVDELEARAREAFAAIGDSSWCDYFCPDVLIASPSLEAFREGRFHCVLGEVHSNNTLLWSALVNQHPNVQSIERALAQDVTNKTVVLVQTPKARWVSRLNVMALPTFWRYEHGEDPPSLPACRSLPAAVLVASDDGTTVRMTARDRRAAFDAYELFAVTMSYEADRIVSAMLRNGPHSPRVTIGDLTVAREQWQTTPEQMPFLTESDPCALFAGIGEWARAQGMPRHVFYKSPGETKPCYLDFYSPLYTSVFAKLMRRLRGTASVRIVEMLPAPTDTWLPDSAGARYTSEIRIVARRDE
jgi:acyl carrier protein